MTEQICFNNVILSTAREVFETMIFMDIEESSSPDHEIEGDALLGSITFKMGVQGGLVGCMNICCSTTCAKVIAMNMLGMEIDDELSKEEICDAMGEVTNMVMGGIKKQLDDSTGSFNISIPTVISGRKLQNSLGDKASKVLVKINIEDEYPAEFSLLSF